jgi:hypothetical protein
MAFDKYKNGAWMEPESGVKKYVNGAWTDCETAKKYADGAWTDVWNNKLIMTQYLAGIYETNPPTKGILQISDDGFTFNFIKIMGTDMDGSYYGTMSGGGYLGFYVYRDNTGLKTWENPTVSFDWEGGFISKASDDSWRRISAGSITLEAYNAHNDSLGTSDDNDPDVRVTIEAVPTVGSTYTGSSVSDQIGSYNQTIEGSWTRLLIKIYISSFMGTYDNASLSLIIRNLKIDNQRIAFPESAEFELQEWPT